MRRLSKTSENITWKRCRNTYANLLRFQLCRGQLEAPFDSEPPSGPLMNLPLHLRVELQAERRKQQPRLRTQSPRHHIAAVALPGSTHDGHHEQGGLAWEKARANESQQAASATGTLSMHVPGAAVTSEHEGFMPGSWGGERVPCSISGASTRYREAHVQPIAQDIQDGTSSGVAAALNIGAELASDWAGPGSVACKFARSGAHQLVGSCNGYRRHIHGTPKDTPCAPSSNPGRRDSVGCGEDVLEKPTTESARLRSATSELVRPRASGLACCAPAIALGICPGGTAATELGIRSGRWAPREHSAEGAAQPLSTVDRWRVWREQKQRTEEAERQRGLDLQSKVDACRRLLSTTSHVRPRPSLRRCSLWLGT